MEVRNILRKEKEKTNQYIDNLYLTWFFLVVIIYMFTIADTREGANYVLYILLFAIIIRLLVSLYKLFNIIDKMDDPKDKKDILNIFKPKEFVQRNIFNYLKSFPTEHPYLMISSIGLVFTEQYVNLSERLILFQNVPVIKYFFPTLPLIILLLIFCEYTHHIKTDYLRRAFKVVSFIYSPIIIGFFFLGLIGPAFIIVREVVTIASIQEILISLSDPKNLFWVLVYPLAVLLLLQCSLQEQLKGTKLIPSK